MTSPIQIADSVIELLDISETEIVEIFEALPGEAGVIVSATAIQLVAGSAPTVTLGGTPTQRTIEFGIPASDGTGTGTVASTDITDSTAIGRSVLTATTEALARTAIGAGTSSLVLGTTADTAMRGDFVPTKATVGLGNVDNTSDASKPVSTAQQNALNAKANRAVSERLVYHDGTAGGFTRETGWFRYRIIGGSTRPTNMAAGDAWEREA